MKKAGLFIVIILIGIVLVGCDFEGDEQRSKIAETLATFKGALNAGDRPTLLELVSDDYAYDNMKRNAFVDRTLSRRTYINGSSLNKIDLSADKKQANAYIEWRTAGPQVAVRVPIFQKEVPSVNTTMLRQARFGMQRERGEENKEVWRITEAEERSVVQDAVYGKAPRITMLDCMPETPRPGQTVEVRIRITKYSDDNGIFLAVNGVPLGSYVQGGLPNKELNDTFLQIFRIPNEMKPGSFYKIEVLAFEGRVDPMQIYLSDLTGFDQKVVSLPVR